MVPRPLCSCNLGTEVKKIKNPSSRTLTSQKLFIKRIEKVLEQVQNAVGFQVCQTFEVKCLLMKWNRVHTKQKKWSHATAISQLSCTSFFPLQWQMVQPALKRKWKALQPRCPCLHRQWLNVRRPCTVCLLHHTISTLYNICASLFDTPQPTQHPGIIQAQRSNVHLLSDLWHMGNHERHSYIFSAD